MNGWTEGMPKPKQKTPEEIAELKQKRLEEKLEKRKRKGYEIPKHKKEGMQREEDFQKRWNTYGETTEKKYNVKGRLDFTEEAEPEEETKKERPAVRVPKPAKRTKQKRSERQDFRKGATRTPNSGATWYSKGDVKLSHALVEVKERGSVNSRGEKTISIPKSWLTKQADEAFEERRPYWYLAFAYKNDDEIYVIKPYDHELEMVHEFEHLQEKYQKLQEDYSKLKEEHK